MSTSAEKYGQFVGLLRERKLLGSTMSLLGWDEQVNLPPAASPIRAEQLSAMAKVIHEKNTAPEYVGLLRELIESDALSGDERAVVRETWRDIERALKVPPRLVAEISRAESESYATWIEARNKNSYAHVKARLAELIALKKEYADCIRGSRTPYDALLDYYEPGLTAAETNAIFSRLGPELSTLVGRCNERNAGAVRKKPWRAAFPKEAQKDLNIEVSKLMGFDFNRGRLDEAVHPFCNDIGAQDVRMTTRYYEDDFCPSLYGTMHEAGHGLYELGYDAATHFTPLSEYCSMGIHESQSRLWENMVGRSKEFLSHLAPLMAKKFPAALAGVPLEAIDRYVNWVSPSLIRVEADEVSYGLHIIIRFELEQALFAGKIGIDDLPAAWDAGYEKYLGIKAPEEKKGVLQDVHWFTGAFGYFPTYLLGSAYAAQIFAAAEKAMPNLRSEIAAGRLLELREWLRKKIHREGRRYEAKELMRRATGEEPKPEYYLEYLNAKFS